MDIIIIIIIIIITKDNFARYSTHSEEGVIKLKTGYPLVPQDHGLISALETLSKHYVRTIIIIIIIIIIIDLPVGNWSHTRVLHPYGHCIVPPVICLYEMSLI